jgi:hypothetical protein
MPALLTAWVCALFYGMPPLYWLLALPLLLTATFMSTLAEIRDEGRRIRVKRLWSSMDVPKADVVGTARSALEGIGALQLKRFVFPWGKIYFVSAWSKLGVAQPRESRTDSDVRCARGGLHPCRSAVRGIRGLPNKETELCQRYDVPGYVCRRAYPLVGKGPAFVYNPIGAAWHLLHDVLGLGGHSSCP